MTGHEKAQEKAVEKEVKEYTYYNEKMMQTSYESGDIYDHERFGAAKVAWEIRFVKSILTDRISSNINTTSSQ
jgi:hypothetical protein